MKYNKLKCLDIKLPYIGLGGWQLGGHGWGKVSEKEMVEAVHRAIDSGIFFFDTAPIYGLGYSEEVLGKSLATERENVVIATKVGLVWKKNKTFEKFADSSPANIRREIDMSLKRLKTDYIDLYQIHWPDPNTPIEDTLGAMEELKESGKIRCIGCCNFSLELLEEALKYGKIDAIQVPYNLIDRKIEKDLLPFCKKKGIGVLAYSPIARGFLTGKYDKNTKFELDDHRSWSRDEYFQSEALLKNLTVLEKVKLIAKRLDRTPTQIALRWVLENHGVTVAIFGAKNAAQIAENSVALDFTLSKEDMVFLNEEIQKV
jgi:aryl-alcohol dehydrogenase-like predicted oxidoreductase